MIADLIAAYYNYFAVAFCICLSLVAGWNTFRGIGAGE